MNYGKRVAFLIATCVIVALVLLVLFFLSAQNTVEGMRWHIEVPQITSNQ